jgi:S-adenosylmethionine hydrolase
MSGRWPRPSGVVTLLTDFGQDDAYVATLKGIVLEINPRARLIDLTHAVPPQDVRRGALLLAAAWRYFPRGTVHLAVVDPGVGTGRRAIAVEAGGQYFVGPDNGLLECGLGLPGARGVLLTARRYQRRTVSRTFHGRDVFAPAAAHCSRGVPLDAFGPALGDPVRLRFPRARWSRGRLEGEVLLVDRFGNLLTNLPGDRLPGAPGRGILRVGRARLRGLVATYAARPRGALGALVDSSGRVEVFVRDGSARRQLGVRPGAAVSWSPPARASTLPRPRRPGSRRSAPRSPSWRAPSRRSRRRHRPSSRPPSPSSGARRGSRSRTTRRPSK